MTGRDRNIARTVAVVAGAVVAAPAAAGVAVGAMAARQVFHPKRRPGARKPPDDGLGVVSLALRSSFDGTQLALWVVPGRGPHTVVVSHGMGRNMSAVKPHIRMLHAAGHNVVAYDLRNHGRSDDDRAYGRMAERLTSDLRDVVGHVRSDPRLGSVGIAILALSLSTWPAVHLLRDPSVPVDALVCDSGPACDIVAAFRRVFDLRRTTLPRVVRRPPLYGLSRLSFERFAEHMLATDDWPPDLAGVTTPMLFVAGGRDPVMPAEVVIDVAGRYPWATSWVAPSAVHTNGIRAEREEYSQRLLEFLAGAFAATEPMANTSD